MATITYATIDNNALGPALETTASTTLVYNDNNIDIQRMARCTQGHSTGIAQFECVFYGTSLLAGINTMANMVSVGVAQATAALDHYVGYGTDSYGFRAGDGGIYNNNTVAVATEITTTQVTITVVLDLNASPQTCSWYVLGTLIASVNLPAGQVWYPAVTVSGVQAYDLTAFLNFGERRFDYALAPAWAITNSSVAPIYLTTTEEGGYISRSTDVPANVTYLPRILNGDAFSITRTAETWPQASSLGGITSSAVTVALIELDNWDGLFDYLINADIRDVVVVAQIVVFNVDTSRTIQTVGTFIIDKPDAASEDVMRIAFKDILNKLQFPVQKRLYPPYTDPAAANRQVLISLGANRNMEPLLLDGPNRIYSLGDAPVTNIATVRDKGTPLDPYSIPPQFHASNDAQNLILETLPEGKLTTDLSNQGAQIIIPGVADVLAGIGQFGTNPWTGSVPDNWTVQVIGGSSISKYGVSQGYPDFCVRLLTNRTWDRFGTVGQNGYYLRTTANVLEAGQTYIITFRLYSANGAPPDNPDALSAGLQVRSALDRNPQSAISPDNAPLQISWLGPSQQYTFQYTCPGGVGSGLDRPLYFVACASMASSGVASTGNASIVFADVRVELLSYQPVQPLQGITLENYFREIIENRAGLSAGDWVSTDAADIDDATGYTFGVHIKEPLTVQAALEKPLDSFCSALFTDSLGRLRVRRLVDPRTVDSSAVVYTFDTNNVKRPIMVRPDFAPGLTTLFGARRNNYIFSATDFVSDYIRVPAALRTQFMRQSQFLLTSNKSLFGLYAHALSASALDSYLDDPEQAQLEINRVCGFYSTDRVAIPQFVTFTGYYAPTATTPVPDIMFGDIISFQYNRFGFETPVQLYVFESTLVPYANEITITAWG